ncbi:MAG: tripartite tricarboxylate transporter substrate binding protein [Pseudomonadota bacterium]
MNAFNAVVRMATIGALMMAIAGPVAAQQSYPGKPIRFISPYAPGGGTSIVARIISQKLSESWGQPVIVDNRPGANTMIGAETLVKSAPDGYTIYITAVTHVVVPLLFKPPYDVIKDFAPVATLTRGEFVLVIHPSVPANNLQELIALAKARPGQLNYASTGAGSIQHLGGELFNMIAGVDIRHIPYKGSGPAAADLLGGQVQMFFSPPITVIPYINNGRLKAIAITGEKRKSALPQVPTMAEAGMPGYEVRTWYGILAPAGTPRSIVDKLSTEIARILALPDVTEKLISLGLEPLVSTPAQFATLMKADMDRYAKIVRDAKIKLKY